MEKVNVYNIETLKKLLVLLNFKLLNIICLQLRRNTIVTDPEH